MATVTTGADIILIERKRVSYREKSFLGIFKWKVKCSEVRIGCDIVIETDLKIDDVFLNSKKL